MQDAAVPPILSVAFPGEQSLSGWPLLHYCGLPAPPALDPCVPPFSDSDPALQTGWALQPHPQTLGLAPADRVLDWTKNPGDIQTGKWHYDYCHAKIPLLARKTAHGVEAGCHRTACRGCHSAQGDGGLSGPMEPPPAMGTMQRLSMTVQQKLPEM